MVRYIWIVFLLFASCALKQPTLQKPVLIVWKTPQFRFYDQGFLRRDKKSVELVVYEAGKALFSLRLGKRVCIKKRGCFRYEMFNKKFLSPFYPPSLIRDILLKRAIFSKENLHKTKEGFIQKISSIHYDIIYKITDTQIYFKDRKNGILIKIKEIDE